MTAALRAFDQLLIKKRAEQCATINCCSNVVFHNRMPWENDLFSFYKTWRLNIGYRS